MNKDDWIKKNKEESHHVSILMQRIAELEKQLELHKNAHHKCVEILQQKQSEPVAWTWFSSEENTSPYTQMTGYTTECWSRSKPDESVKIDEGTLMPLYTAPQTKPHPKCDEACMYLCTAKPLSDEQINQLWRKVLADSLSWEGLQNKTTVDIEFARAIEKEHRIK